MPKKLPGKFAIEQLGPKWRVLWTYLECPFVIGPLLDTEDDAKRYKHEFCGALATLRRDARAPLHRKIESLDRKK